MPSAISTVCPGWTTAAAAAMVQNGAASVPVPLSVQFAPAALLTERVPPAAAALPAPTAGRATVPSSVAPTASAVRILEIGAPLGL